MDDGKLYECLGLPPGSCAAFGPVMVPRLNERHACTPCPGGDPGPLDLHVGQDRSS